MKNLETFGALKNFIEENKCFSIVGQVVMCKVCTTGFIYTPKKGVATLKQHLNTKSHKRNEKSPFRQRSLFNISKDGLDTYHEFDISLLKAFTAAQIPLSKLEHPIFKAFLEKYTNMSLKPESWYRKCLMSKLYTNEIEKKYAELSKKNIYLMFDETTDASGRYILNLLAGECSREERMRPILFRSIEMERTNSVNINQIILNFLTKLHGGQIDFGRVKMILSDQAPYAIKVGKCLKELIPELKHVTCLCHLIHRLCEAIRNRCLKLNYIQLVQKLREHLKKLNLRTFPHVDCY